MGPKSVKERNAAGLCGRRRCTELLVDGSAWCADHTDQNAAMARAGMARTREKRRLAGRCIDGCGAKYTGKWVCPACRLRRGHARRPRRRDDRADRVAAATRVHADGRRRYHGTGQKGPQPKIRQDEQDLADARRLLDVGEAGLRQYEDAVAARVPVFQRDNLRDAAVHQLRRAAGHIVEVMRRRGHFERRHLGLPDDDIDDEPIQLPPPRQRQPGKLRNDDQTDIPARPRRDRARAQR